MDVYCKRCGEPWGFLSIEEDMTELQQKLFWNGECCPSCFGKEIEKRPFRAELTEALHSVLGNDLDGLASALEDAEHCLGKEFWE